MFTEKEIAYLTTNRLARLGTTDSDNWVDVVPVAYQFDNGHFYIGGMFITTSRKYKNVVGGHVKVGLVIDDVIDNEPMGLRGVRVYGTAEIVEYHGQFGPAIHLKITPVQSWSWGIEGAVFVEGKLVTHKTQHGLAQK